MRFAVLAMLCFLALAPPRIVFAYTARVTPLLTVEEAYTDNVNLASSGNEDDEFVTQINPGAEIVVDGPRASAQMRYNMQNIIYGSDRYDDMTFHQFLGSGTLTVVPETGYIDLAGRYAQRAIDPEEASSFDNVSITENRTDVATSRISPYLQHQIGTSAKSELRYARERVDYSDDTIEKSESDLWVLTVGSIDQNEKVSWESSYRNEEVSANGTAVRFETAELSTGYQATGRTRLIARFGGENNEYIEESGDVPEGRFWQFGAKWTLGPRSEVVALVGERYFGKTYEASIRRFGRYLTSELSYTETLTTAALSDARYLDSNEAAGGNETAPAKVDAEVYLRKYLRAALSIKKSKTETNVRIFSERRDYVVSNDVQVDGADVVWQWSIRQRSMLSVEAAWRKYTGDDVDDDSRSSSLKIGMTERLSSLSSGYLYVERARRESDSGADEYMQNAIHIGLTKRFR